MSLRLFLLLIICATFQFLGTNGLTRVKRVPNLENHNERIKEDFVMLHNEKQDHLENSKENIKTAYYDTVSASAASSDDSKNILADSNKKRNASRPLVEILRNMGHDSYESRKEAANKSDVPTADNKSEVSSTNNEKLHTLADRRSNINGIVEEHSRHHKNKHLPHVIQSTGMLEAQIFLPTQHIKSAYKSLGSTDSMQQRIMNLDNMMMFKVGLDSAPYNSYYPRMILPSSIYEEDALNEPNLNYFFNSFETPKGHHYLRQALKQSSTPVIDDGWHTTHAILYKPPAAVKEPTQLVSLMQNALDTLLANSENIEGDKSEQQIEFRCPVHHGKKSAPIEGDKAEDVIQVCSCRFIKKAKDDEVKKLK